MSFALAIDLADSIERTPVSVLRLNSYNNCIKALTVPSICTVTRERQGLPYVSLHDTLRDNNATFGYYYSGKTARCICQVDVILIFLSLRPDVLFKTTCALAEVQRRVY